MASSRVLSRLFIPAHLSRIANRNGGQIRQFWHHHHRHHLPEKYFGPMSNIVERFEKEFDRMQQQFNNLFQDVKNSRPLTVYSTNQGQRNDMIITEADGSKKFHLSLNIRDFEPEEIKIKTEHGCLTISGKKEKKSNDNYFLQEFSQTYSLPNDIKIDDLKSTYTENGILSIEAPLQKEQPKDREIKIERIK